MENFHEEIIGRSGFGKSTYLENLILACEGGFVFLDPHGQSAEKIADTVDCIYWDAADTEHIIGYNPIKDISLGHRPYVAAQIVYAFKALYGQSWGPRLEWILYNSVRLLLDNNASLLDIPRLLTDKRFRTQCLLKASFRDFWDGEFANWNERYREEAIAPVLNKVGQLAANPVLAGILSRNTIDLSRVMDRSQRLVVNLAKGKLGDEPSHLLGALLIAGLYTAAQGRIAIPEAERTPVRIFADEFQNFATQSFADILSEARKYGLSLTIAHQYLAQVPEELLPAVFANVGRITAFNVSAEDAAFLGREMDLSPQALQDLSKFEAWQKTGLDRTSIKTPPPITPRSRLQAVKSRTIARYTRRE